MSWLAAKFMFEIGESICIPVSSKNLDLPWLILIILMIVLLIYYCYNYGLIND